ncbi:MAG: tetratricopeptide repeat protein [Planctomycetes bacterium]|jgi:tetratricopeptide (TPR) repeat protein|nr:tetratricopeptide repeat protein [Planctomycetota bacterium]
MTTIETLLSEARRSWGDAVTLARIGKELQDRNRLAAAREVLSRAVELDPRSDPEAWEYLAFAHYRDSDAEGGLSALRRGVEATGADTVRSTLMNFTEDEAEAALLRAELEGSADPVARASLWWKRLNEGEVETALAAIRAAVAAHPANRELRGLFLWTLLSGKRMGKVADLCAEGLPLCDRAVADEPDRSFSWVMKLMMHAAEKDHDGAIRTGLAALRRFPDEESIMQFVGRAFREKGDPDRAALWFARAIGAKPSFAGARVDLGKLLETQGKLDLAEEIFREIPVANPHYAMGPVSLALFLARRERWAEAETVFLEAWPRLLDWQRKSVKGNPDAAALLARENVKKAI